MKDSDPLRRRRFRPKRLVPVLLFVAVAVFGSWFMESRATTTVIIVRHAEKLAEPEDDPGLSTAGRLRAERLAHMLRKVDVVAGVDLIFATQYRRTQETARPLADALGLEINIADASDVEGLIETIESEHVGKIVLIVAHSNTVPAYVRELSGSKRIEPIRDDDYSKMFIVTQPWFGKTKTLQLEYGPEG